MLKSKGKIMKYLMMLLLLLMIGCECNKHKEKKHSKKWQKKIDLLKGDGFTLTKEINTGLIWNNGKFLGKDVNGKTWKLTYDHGELVSKEEPLTGFKPVGKNLNNDILIELESLKKELAELKSRPTTTETSTTDDY